MQRGLPIFLDTKTLGDSRHHPAGITHRSERHKNRAIHKICLEAVCNVDGEPRLADTRWPGDCYQPTGRVKQQVMEQQRIVLAAHKRAKRDREGARVRERPSLIISWRFASE